jgi:integrase
MATKIKFTSTAVEKLSAPGIYWDTQEPGLGVRIAFNKQTKRTLKTWFYKRRVKGGVERNVTLGRHGDPVKLPDGTMRTFAFGADDARSMVAALLADMLKGIDPVQRERDSKAAAVVKAAVDKALGTTLQQVIDDYLAHHRVKGRPLRPRTAADYSEFMGRQFKAWLPQPVVGITRTMCDDRIREIEIKSPVQAHKGRVYLRLFLNHARVMHSTDDGDPVLPINPVSRMVTKTHAAKPRDRRIPLGKLGAIWSMLRKRCENPRRDLDRTAADWVSLMLLTGWRLTESASLRWSQVDFDARTVTLLGEVVKNHNEVILPMSTELHDLLKARKELTTSDAQFVFPGVGESAHIVNPRGTMDELSKAAGLHIAVHDLRRTAESVALACHIDYSYRMRLLNHKPAGVHDSAYGNDTNPETLRGPVQQIATFIVDASKVYDAQQAGHNVISFPGKTG